MITVHHLNASRSERIIWLLEELGLPYTIKRYQRTATMQAPAELKAIHPLGQSPVIEDGGRIFAESGAILEYLIERYGHGLGLKPEAGSEAALRYTYWMHYAEGSFMPQLLLALITGVIARSPAPFFVKPILKSVSSKLNEKLVAPSLFSHAAFIESELQSRPYFAGPNFSAADIQMSYPLSAAFGRSEAFRNKPAIQSWLERVQSRPAYQRAVTAIGPEPGLGKG